MGGRLIVTDQALSGSSWGAHKPAPFLDSAIGRTAAQYLSSCSPDYLADREARSYMWAYLKLVQASVLWRANRKLSALPSLIQSLAANPA
jgi:hypothetical protein